MLANKAEIRKLTLEDFLKRGKAILDDHLCDPGLCPFCGKPADLDQLVEHLRARLEQYEAVRRDFEAVGVLRTAYAAALNGVANTCTALEGRCAVFPPDAQALLKEFARAAAEHSRGVRARFERYEPISDMAGFRALREKFTAMLRLQITAAHEAAKALELTEAERRIIDLITTIKALRDTFDEYYSNSIIKRAYEKQIASLQTIFTGFVAVQSAALQNVLDLVSSDVGRYYGILHPDENVDKVRLRVVGEEGIEFEYSFHGEPTYPPMKYLSESHLNSLGISLFLASAKLFNRQSQFFVLDDVITSFDIGHRRRLIRLLADEFSNWQVVLLTHEPFWFDMIKRELVPCGWLAAEVCYDAENGTQIKGSPMDLRELIRMKRTQRIRVSNDVRTLIERVLKELCESLEVKVAFRHNDANERRMSQELLSALRSTLNKKCLALKDHSVLNRLDASVFVTNAGSHDRPDAISDSDVDVALGDSDTLQSLFWCPDCSRSVSVRQIVPGGHEIACRCGKKKIPWKI